MAWDLQLSIHGDLVWNGNNDLASAVGDGINRQRIATRLRIPAGSFIYNAEIGSRLRSLLGLGIPSTEKNIEGLVRDALSPMTDITILAVNISYPDGRTMQVGVIYQPSNDAGIYSPDITPQEQATVLFPG